jgi:hypothetical protein
MRLTVALKRVDLRSVNDVRSGFASFRRRLRAADSIAVSLPVCLSLVC